ncbi:hypothetical protein FRC09_006949, partial [Ceratobasidium sp. 395]
MYPRPGTGTTDDVFAISCRFIATDQWFRTHIDPAWSIFELKRHLLARCVGGVPLAPATAHTGPRLLVPSQQGKVTLAGLVRPPHTSRAIKSSARPSTAPHDGDHARRKPRLSLKVVPGLSSSSKPAPAPQRMVNVHPPTPAGLYSYGAIGFGYGVPGLGATAPPPPPPVTFLPRNPLSSPELSPPRFAPQPPDDESSPSSPNTAPSTTVGQPQSPTFSSSGPGTSPPSRPFSPTSLPGPVESQPLFSPTDAHHQRLMFGDLVPTSPSAVSLRARSTPPLLVRAMSTPPSPYSPKPPTPTMARPPPISPPPPSGITRSPPLSSSLQSRYDLSKLEAEFTNMSTTSTIVDDSTLGSDSTHSPLLSVAEFLDTQEPTAAAAVAAEKSYDFVAARSPSPPGPGTAATAGGLIKSGVEILMSGAGAVRGKSSREYMAVGTQRTSWEDEFRLVSFALGCVLDEHGTVGDLRIRPGELIEIQRTNATVHLARPTYTQPYFEAPVYVLKRLSSTSSSSAYTRPHTAHAHHHHPPIRPHQHHIQPLRDYSHPPPPPPPLAHASIEPLSPMDPGPSGTRVRSGTVTARDTSMAGSFWDVEQDQDGEGDGEGWAELEMSGLEGISTGGSGGGGMGKVSSGWGGEDSMGVGMGMGMGGSEKVEWKLKWLVMREGRLSLFKSRTGQQVCSRPLASLLSAQQLPAIPALGTLPRHYVSIHFTSPSRKERDGEFGIRMMDAHAHFLRVLLRIINTPGPHTFLQTDTPYLPTSAPLASQYPEWRQHVVQRAWLAGRGTAQMHVASGNVAGPWMTTHPWMGLPGLGGTGLGLGGISSALTERELEMLDQDESDESAGSMATAESPGGAGGSPGGMLYDVLEDESGSGSGPRGDESEIEWDVEGWRAWESENAGGAWGGGAWLKGLGVATPGGGSGGRPRSRSLAAPISRSASQQTTPQPHHYQQQQQSMEPQQQTLLSPVSTVSSELSISSASPSTRRGRSSTIAAGGGGGGGPDSPVSTSPSAWSPISSTSPVIGSSTRRPLTAGSSTGIETVLRTSERRGSAQTDQQRRGSTQTSRGSSQVDQRRGSATSLEMQRAVPSSRRAVT